MTCGVVAAAVSAMVWNSDDPPRKDSTDAPASNHVPPSPGHGLTSCRRQFTAGTRRLISSAQLAVDGGQDHSSVTESGRALRIGFDRCDRRTEMDDSVADHVAVVEDSA